MDTGYNDKAIFHPNIQEESLFQTPLWAITIRYWMFFYLGEYYSFQNVGRPCSSNRLIRVIPRLLVSTSLKSSVLLCLCKTNQQNTRLVLSEKKRIPKCIPAQTAPARHMYKTLEWLTVSLFDLSCSYLFLSPSPQELSIPRFKMLVSNNTKKNLQL